MKNGQWFLLALIVAFILWKKTIKKPVQKAAQKNMKRSGKQARIIRNRPTVGCSFNSGGTISTGIPETMCGACTGAVRRKPTKGGNFRMRVPKHLAFPVNPSLPPCLAIQTRRRGR